MRARKYLFVLLVVVLFCLNAHAATSRNKVLNRLEEFRRFFNDFQLAPDSAVPGELLAQCHGVIIMREYKAGFGLGVRGGDGVVLLHDPSTGQWSPPAFVKSGEGSFGFQIGGQAIDAIILIMNRDGEDMLLRTRFKIGVDASAAAGPVGRDASAKVGPGTALLAYSRAKGLYAGVAFEGGAMLNNNDYNRAMYGRDVGLKEILVDGVVSFPEEALAMVETLNNYAWTEAAQVVATVREPEVIAIESAVPEMQPLAPEPSAPGLPDLEPFVPASASAGPSAEDLHARAAEAAVAAQKAAVAAQEAAKVAEEAAKAAEAAKKQ